MNHTEVPVLRSVGIPREPLRIVQPLTALSARPTAPTRPLTARPLGHDLPDYDVTPAPKTTTKPPTVPYRAPGPPISRDLVFHPDVQGPADRYDTHQFQQAFGGAA